MTTLSTAGNDRGAKAVIWITTIIICLAITVLQQKWLPRPEITPGFIFLLPGLNAILNGTCSLLLIASFLAVRNKRYDLHKKLNLGALALSSLFLISYVTAHYFIPDTRYGDVDHDGIMSVAESAAVSGVKPVYLVILLSHILLAVIVLPLVLLSFYYGLTDQRQKHRRITRFSFPIWLYVTVTGVLVYLMIKPYYPF